MTWVRIDDHFDEHPKLARVGPLGWALWLAGLAYCNRNLTDGFIPWSVARSLVSWEYLDPPDEQGRLKRWTIGVSTGMHGDDVTCDRVVTLLVSAGLWEDVGDGYVVHDYPDYQPLKEEVLAERAGNAERKRKSRERRRSESAVVTPGVTDVSRRDSGPGHRPPVPVPVPVNRLGVTAAAAPRASAREEPPPQQPESNQNKPNGAPPADEGEYESQLGEALPRLATGTVRLHRQLTEPWLRQSLRELAPKVGHLPRDRLVAGLDLAFEQFGLKAAAGKVSSPRGLAVRLMETYLLEQRGDG